MTIDRDRFLASVRVRPFGGSMVPAQVAGCNAIVDGWEARPELTDLRWLAYMLATAKWETAHTMQPIEEYGHGHGHEYGVSDPVTGKAYYGRGYVQLTWKRNYARLGQLLGVDLVMQPEKALEPMIAAQIMFEGMVRGLFTGVGLPIFFSATSDDPIHARRVINGLDRASEIAAIHWDFLAALGAAAPVARTLKLGDAGPDVRVLQRKLGIQDDGDFGPLTQAAVMALQMRKGLDVDGVVGPLTRAALEVA